MSTKTAATPTPIHFDPTPAAGMAFPHRFQLSEYECVWAEGPREDGEVTGGFVAVRVAHTGDDSQDWSESDVQASTDVEATEIARRLIAEHEDAQAELKAAPCLECAVVLCDCGHYHGTDGTVAIETDRGPLYLFRQTAEQRMQGDVPCGERWQYALSDDQVERLGECKRCEAS